MEIESSKFCPKNLDWFYQGYLVVNKYWEINWSINFIIPFSKSFTLIFSKKSGNPSSDVYPWSQFDGNELHMEIENDATNGIFRNDAKFDFDVLADLIPENLSLWGQDVFWVTWKSNLVHSRPFSVQYQIATILQLLKRFYQLQQKLQRQQKALEVSNVKICNIIFDIKYILLLLEYNIPNIQFKQYIESMDNLKNSKTHDLKAKHTVIDE